MTITISELLLEDLDKIIEIEDTLYVKPWQKKDYLYELNDNPYANYLKMSIKETGEIIGYIGFWIKFEFAEITKVSIKKEYQGHKLSKLLMADCIRRIKLASCVNITLEVRTSNVVAKHLYESFGFVATATRKKYYENGEDAILMIKELNDDNTSD